MIVIRNHHGRARRDHQGGNGGRTSLGLNGKEAGTRMKASALASKARDTEGDVVYDTLPGIRDGAFVIGAGSTVQSGGLRGATRRKPIWGAMPRTGFTTEESPAREIP